MSCDSWKSVSKNLRSITKHLRQTLIFMWNSALREKFNFCFSWDFYLEHTSYSFREEDWALGIYSVKFWDFPDICQFPKILSRLATSETTLTYHLITNHHAPFHLRWKGNVLNHQKVSKWYEHDCRKKRYLSTY